MKKIPTLFIRDRKTNLVIDEVNPGCEWVINGEGIATRKFDGTCCMVRNGKLYKRYDAKKGRTPPDGFEAAQEPDPITGHQPGWILVGDGPDDKYHREAIANFGSVWPLPDGTYELVGPKIQGNPEMLSYQTFVSHGKYFMPDCPHDYESLKAYLESLSYEGIVWHHPDGRMTKLKRKDFFR